MAYVSNPPSPQTLTLKILGLYTNSNELSAAPDGALVTADNIVISKDSIAEPRRGYDYLSHTLPNSGDRADKFFAFQNKLIVHYNDTGTTNANDTLAYYDSSTGINNYSGAYAHPDPLLARIKFAESNKNCYFTSATGVYRLDSVTGTPAQAGMYPGLDVNATASASVSGFMSNNAEVAYRVLWGITDANSNLILGAPSQRAVISNSSGGVQNVSLQITIPSGVTTSHFYQIYRSNQSASSSTTPDDNMQLVYEANPTAGEITAKSITVIDSVPDSLRGAALYTNATQQGILQANTPPPYATDLCLFQTCMFYSNTQTPQQLFLSILAVGGSSGVQLTDTVTIAGTTYTAGNAENAGTKTYHLVTGGSPAQNINDTALSLIRVINQNSTNTSVYAYYISTVNGLPGQMLIQSRTLGASSFAVTASADGSAWSPTLPTSGTTISSTNTANLNGLMYSKAGQPDAVPSTNILYVGSANKKILRIVPIRNSLFIMKEDGVFRCTGVAGNFSVDVIDTTINVLAPETVVPLSNQVFALTTQGVVSISDNGGPVLSRPIENQILSLEGAGLTSLQYYSFAIGYESERQYILYTISASGDTYATQGFCYNTFTKTWTRVTRQQTWGFVSPVDNKIYLCNPSSNKLSQERKDYLFTDYADESSTVTISSSTGTSVVLSTVTGISVGDRLYQSLNVSSVITAINSSNNTLTVYDTLTWSNGSAMILKGYNCTMEWIPNSAGNPGYIRHWREMTAVFKQSIFNYASFNFYSEISPSTDTVTMYGASTGGWGNFIWGSQPWGGIQRTTPFRTYIPTNKQRCDLLSIQFEVQAAWAQFQCEGLSCIFQTIGERTTL